jgi:hypothetical protein
MDTYAYILGERKGRDGKLLYNSHWPGLLYICVVAYNMFYRKWAKEWKDESWSGCVAMCFDQLPNGELLNIFSEEFDVMASESVH